MNKVHLKKAVKPYEILTVSELAHITWRQHYPGIISPDQVEYMLQKFQTPGAISQAIAEGYEYYLIRHTGVPVGYLAVKINEPQGKLFLSKIYLLAEQRGKGYAADAVRQLAERCRRMRLSAIWLTVNKHNPSVAPYEKMGFKIADEAVTEIGGGYVMDDYIMEKTVEA